MVFGDNREETYLRKHKGPIYTGLLLAGKLGVHLAEVDRQAEEMFFQLVEQMAQAKGVNEHLKATDQMEWVGLMNNIRTRVAEIILKESIYA